MSHLRRRLSGTLSLRAVALGMAAALALAGCSDDADGSPGTEDTSETPSPTDETSPTESEPTDEPSVTPATGPVLAPETGGIRLRLPDGWKLDEMQASFQVNGSGPRHRGRVFVTSFPALDHDATLQQLARSAAKIEDFPNGSIQAPLTVGGKRVYHLAGKAAGGLQEEFGLLLDGDQLTVSFELDGIPKAERQPLIESVLATVEWG